MDLREIAIENVKGMELMQYRDQWRDLVNTVMNLLVP
jgi:hypothetical protein